MRRVGAVALVIGAASAWAEVPEVPKVPRTEWAALPGASYDSGRGVGVALVGMLARFDGETEPYRWRTEAQSFAMFKKGPDGTDVTYQEHYIHVDVPGLLDDRIRVISRIEYMRQSNAGYYGIGNATGMFSGRGYRYHQYDRIYPAVRGDLRVDLPGWLEVFGGLRFSDQRVQLYPDSLLRTEADQDNADLVGLRPHRVVQTQAGVLVDTRDDETWPQKGNFSEISVRGGPGFGQSAFFYGGINATTRGFLGLIERHLVLGGRLITDALLGDPAFYMLSEYGGLYPADGPGGGKSVRGLAERRYHGRIKTIANLELRSRFLYARLLGQPSALGLVTFADGGRVFSRLP